MLFYPDRGGLCFFPCSLFLIDVWFGCFWLTQWESHIDWWGRLYLVGYNLTTDLFMCFSVHRIGQASRSSSAPCLHIRSVWRYVCKCPF